MNTQLAGNNAGFVKYYPYGYCRNSTGDLGTDKLFTGQRLDSTGLYYYGARYYDPEIGRFVSPDSLTQISPSSTDTHLTLSVSYSDTNIINKIGQAYRDGGYYKGGIFVPQLLNRYSYAGNNPMKYYDSSGHFWIVVGAAIGACAGIIAYGMTHENDFQIGEALTWTAIGAVGGAALGLGTEWVAGSLAARGAAAGTTATAAYEAANSPAGQRAIQWLHQDSKINHIMRAGHSWNLVVKLTGNLEQDYKTIQPLVEQTVRTGKGELSVQGGQKLWTYLAEVVVV